MSETKEIGIRKCPCGSMDVALLCDGTERMQCQQCGETGFSGKGGDTELAYNRAAMGWNYRVELIELENWNRVAERVLRMVLPDAKKRCMCSSCLITEEALLKRDAADDEHHAMMNGPRIRQAFGLESPAGRAAGAGGVGENATPKEATDNDKVSRRAGNDGGA